MLQPKKTLTKVTRPATNDEAARFGMKKSQDYKDRPKKMATKPASEVPTPKREFISKLNAATEKAKESKGYNVPFGGGSGSKKGDMKSSSSYKSKG